MSDDQADRSPALRLDRKRYENLRPRFGLAYILLAVIVGAAVGGLVVYLGTRGTRSHESWSKWKPTLQGQAGWTQIADHVMPRYRLANKKEIVTVVPTTPEYQAAQGPIPIKHIAITSGLPDEKISDVKTYNVGDGVMFTLCGAQVNPNCSIAGQPTVSRSQVLRREALELALYTFKYQSNIDSVFAVMPPSSTQVDSSGNPIPRAMLFRRPDLRTQLSSPLEKTLSPTAIITPDRIPAAERPRIDSLTNPHFYAFALQQVADGSLLIALQQLLN